MNDALVAFTVMSPEAPLIELVTVSVPVMVCVPVVCSVALKLPVPLLRPASAGRVAEPSELVKCTVPA